MREKSMRIYGLPTPSFSSVRRTVIDTEGRVFEPLGRGHHWILEGKWSVFKNLGSARGMELLAEIA